MTYNTRIFPTRSDMLPRLAEELVKIIHETLEKQYIFRLVIGGGRTQKELNTCIVSMKKPALDWHRLYIYLSDERCVPLSHEQSNFLMNFSSLITPLNIPKTNFYGMETELGPESAAQHYSERIENLRTTQQGSLFDLALLGLGPDGHTASLFPGSPALNEKTLFASAAGIGPEGLPRITLTYPALNSSCKIWIMATGLEKNEPVNRMLHGPYNPATCPAQDVVPFSEEVTLWLDTTAAAKI